MAEDINTTQIAPPDPLDFNEVDENLAKPRKAFKLPDGGKVYTGIIRSVDQLAKGRTKRTGHLQYELKDLEIVAPGQPEDAFKIRFGTYINTMKSQLAGRGSSMIEYLRAHGYQGRPTTDAEYEGAVPLTVGRPFPFYANWEARCKQCNWKLKGFSKFPVAADGTRVSRVTCPNCSTADAPVTVFANLIVSSFGKRG